MKVITFLFYCFVFHLISYAQEQSKVEIALLGTFHFNQVHNLDQPNTNFFGEVLQSDLGNVLDKIKAYKPDRIYIEREPRFQKAVDSLFLLYQNDKVQLKDISGGAGEVYQLAFRLAKELKLRSPLCVNHYESTSQELLNSGKNIEIYRNDLKSFQQLGRGIVGDFIKGKTSLLKTLELMNTPENIRKSHRLFFNTPAYVKEGSFANYKNIDATSMDTNYVGAEFISLFYKRNLKIYSNILNAQLDKGGIKILMITGQTHVGVLQELLQNNINFKVVPLHNYLKL